MDTLEPTPRMIIAQIKDLERISDTRHNDGIHEVLQGRSGDKAFSERDKLKEYARVLREHLQCERVQR